MSELTISRLKGEHLSSTSDYKYRVDMDITDPDSKMSSRTDDWSVEKAVTSNITLGGTLSVIPQSEATVEPSSNSNEVIFDNYEHTSSVDEVLDVYIDDSKDKKKKGFIKIKGNDKISPSGAEPPATPICRITSIEFTEDAGSFSMEISIDQMTNRKIKSLSVTNNENNDRIIAIELEESTGSDAGSGTIPSIRSSDMSKELQVVVDESPTTTNIRQAVVSIG